MIQDVDFVLCGCPRQDQLMEATAVFGLTHPREGLVWPALIYNIYTLLGLVS